MTRPNTGTIEAQGSKSLVDVGSEWINVLPVVVTSTAIIFCNYFKVEVLINLNFIDKFMFALEGGPNIAMFTPFFVIISKTVRLTKWACWT
jgi:hypothetical protein